MNYTLVYLTFEIKFLSASENFDFIRKCIAQTSRSRYKILDWLSFVELVKNSILKNPVILTP